MGVVIKVNGQEIPESLAIVDTLGNSVTLETIFGETALDVGKVHVQVDIFGDVHVAGRE